LAVSYSLTPAKFNKQFKTAGQSGAPLALVVGQEFPEVSLKHLATREEVKLTADSSLASEIFTHLKP
jgi:histidyl-tRNA synthetase